MKSPTALRRLHYRFPLPAYYFFVVLTLLLLQVAFRSSPTEDLSKLSPSVDVAAALTADAAGQKRPFSPQVVWYHLANQVYHVSVRLGLPFWAVQVIAAATVVVHAGEASYAYLLCRRWRASTGALSAYVLLTFLGGFGQLLPLKAAVAELERDSTVPRTQGSKAKAS